jgi:hypothetical protein
MSTTAEAAEIERLRHQIAQDERRQRESRRLIVQVEDLLAEHQATADAAVDEARSLGFADPTVVPTMLDLAHRDPERAREDVRRLVRSRPSIRTSRTGGGTPPRDIPSRRDLTRGPDPVDPVRTAREELLASGRYYRM